MGFDLSLIAELNLNDIKGEQAPSLDAWSTAAALADVRPGSAGYNNYQQWLAGTQLGQKVSLEDYSVSNRGLRSGLVGTPTQVEERIAAFEREGVDFFLLQCSPQPEEMERFADAIIRKAYA